VSTGFPGFNDILHFWDEEEKDFSLSCGIQHILIWQGTAVLWSCNCCSLLLPTAFLGQNTKYSMKNRH